MFRNRAFRVRSKSLQPRESRGRQQHGTDCYPHALQTRLAGRTGRSTVRRTGGGGPGVARGGRVGSGPGPGSGSGWVRGPRGFGWTHGEGVGGVLLAAARGQLHGRAVLVVALPVSGGADRRVDERVHLQVVGVAQVLWVVLVVGVGAVEGVAVAEVEDCLAVEGQAAVRRDHEGGAVVLVVRVVVAFEVGWRNLVSATASPWPGGEEGRVDVLTIETAALAGAAVHSARGGARDVQLGSGEAAVVARVGQLPVVGAVDVGVVGLEREAAHAVPLISELVLRGSRQGRQGSKAEDGEGIEACGRLHGFSDSSVS